MIDDTAAPQLQACTYGGAVIPLANTTFTARVSVDYQNAAAGTVHAQAFRSVEHGATGGVVLRLALDDRGSSLLPVTRTNPQSGNSIDIHLAGADEAGAMLKALRSLLAALKEANQ